MSDSTAGDTNDSQVNKFWENYLLVLKRFGISEGSRPWYRKHVQKFIDDHPQIKLREHRPESLTKWLSRLSNNPALSPWQYRQKIDALRFLFHHFLRVGWAEQFDWYYWSAACEALGNDHPTVARTYESASAGAERPGNFLGQKHPEIYARFIAAIRMTDLSMNTEKSYLGWINRFLRFHKCCRPDVCAEPEVASFFRVFSSKTQGNRRNPGSGT
jgi:hypothetical protein